MLFIQSLKDRNMSHTDRKNTKAQEIERNHEPRPIKQEALKREKAEAGRKSCSASGKTLLDHQIWFSQILYIMESPRGFDVHSGLNHWHSSSEEEVPDSCQ